MKAVFIPTQFTGKLDFERIPLDKLPKKLGMVTTANFSNKAQEAIEFLKKQGKEVHIGKQKQRQDGQLLGCDQGAALAVQDDVDAFLYIGSGEFHPLGVAMNTKKKVYCFNPVTNVFSTFDDKEIEKYQKKKKGHYMKFLTAQTIGIIVSTKPGQYSYNKGKEIKAKLEEQGKQAFIFVCDVLDAQEMGNFPFIEFWINTLCPRIADDRDKTNIIDMSELDF